jgi:hypothetical protein
MCRNRIRRTTLTRGHRQITLHICWMCCRLQIANYHCSANPNYKIATSKFQNLRIELMKSPVSEKSNRHHLWLDWSLHKWRSRKNDLRSFSERSNQWRFARNRILFTKRSKHPTVSPFRFAFYKRFRVPHHHLRLHPICIQFDTRSNKIFSKQSWICLRTTHRILFIRPNHNYVFGYRTKRHYLMSWLDTGSSEIHSRDVAN